MTGPATLAEVARRAGVSPATASRVINHSAKPVTDALRERVLRAVEELRYIPNAHARMLARAERGAIGVIVHDVSDPYFSEITRGLQRVAMHHGSLLVICNSYRDPDREREYVQLLSSQRVSAIVLAGSGYHDAAATRDLDEALRQYELGGGRVAVIGRHELTGHAVQPANTAGGRTVGTYLLGLGHRAIGVLAGPAELTTTTDRLTGLRQVLQAADVPLPAARLVHTDFTRDGGALAAARLLDTDPAITALVAHNDTVAVGALAAARSRALRVPEDLSVVGFDDMPIARDLTPSLTTVRLPLVEMGVRALTLALADHAPGVATVETAAAELVLRDSAAAPRS
ncbi:MAG TPA: LacI family DNA-binding transcriptional regulator [Micromonosporaceae bacterium]|jgi:LacI family transcriptional regulator